ncbi:MAG: helix-turn-helix transcriptional regulator [Gammaproteobacteria bacterium]|nr:helix-turn-helix transcriptional regulator [Gammaproteobacteria bacterium]
MLAVEPLVLPKLETLRLKRIAQALQKNPDNNNTLADWGQIVGASSRTLTRLFLKETKMNFQQWRTQFRLLKSIEWLAQGMTIQQISQQLGYANSGAFIHMFRKAFGVTPKCYFKK